MNFRFKKPSRKCKQNLRIYCTCIGAGSRGAAAPLLIFWPPPWATFSTTKVPLGDFFYDEHNFFYDESLVHYRYN